MLYHVQIYYDCLLSRWQGLAAVTLFSLFIDHHQVFSRAVHDGKSHKPKKILPVPHAEGGGRTSYDLLHHKPEIRVGSHIPYGGLAQEARGARMQPAAQKHYGGASLLGTGTL